MTWLLLAASASVGLAGIGSLFVALEIGVGSRYVFVDSGALGLGYDEGATGTRVRARDPRHLGYFVVSSQSPNGYEYGVSVIIPTIALGIAGLWLLWSLPAYKRHQCQECGYDLSGTVGLECPECGTRVLRRDAREPPPPDKG